MANLLRFQSHIVVVDPRPADYRELSTLAGQQGWHIHLLTNARAAVRFARSTPVDLWMIATTLPDMSGFELYEVLRDQLLGARVFIVAEQYDQDEERRVCGCGAALYLCKSATGGVDCNVLLDLLVQGAAHPGHGPGHAVTADRLSQRST